MVHEAVEPADGEVVEQRQDPSRRDGVVGAHVGHDGDLTGQRHRGAHKVSEERGEGALEDPIFEGMEDELAAAVGVLLPARELVVDRQRDALFEAFTGVRGEAADVPGGL